MRDAPTDRIDLGLPATATLELGRPAEAAIPAAPATRVIRARRAWVLVLSALVGTAGGLLAAVVTEPLPDLAGMPSPIPRVAWPTGWPDPATPGRPAASTATPGRPAASTATADRPVTATATPATAASTATPGRSATVTPPPATPPPGVPAEPPAEPQPATPPTDPGTPEPVSPTPADPTGSPSAG
jgi:hypothetical protein